MFKYLKISTVFIWSGLIYYLATTPQPGYPDFGISNLDKITHAVLFGVLSFLIIAAFDFYKKIKFKYWLFISFIASSFYAALIEIIQLNIPGRSASLADFLAAVAGVIIALIIFYEKNIKKIKT